MDSFNDPKKIAMAGSAILAASAALYTAKSWTQGSKESVKVEPTGSVTPK